MKSIVVKLKNGCVACFSSGVWRQVNKDGTNIPIEKTDEENEQACYQSLIDHVKREEFEKNIKYILNNYREENMDNIKNIQIKIEYRTGGFCEMNISNWNDSDLIPMDITKL